MAAWSDRWPRARRRPAAGFPLPKSRRGPARAAGAVREASGIEPGKSASTSRSTARTGPTRPSPRRGTARAASRRPRGPWPGDALGELGDQTRSPPSWRARWRAAGSPSARGAGTRNPRRRARGVAPSRKRCRLLERQAHLRGVELRLERQPGPVGAAEHGSRRGRPRDVRGVPAVDPGRGQAVGLLARRESARRNAAKSRGRT